MLITHRRRAESSVDCRPCHVCMHVYRSTGSVAAGGRGQSPVPIQTGSRSGACLGHAVECACACIRQKGEQAMPRLDQQQQTQRPQRPGPTDSEARQCPTQAIDRPRSMDRFDRSISTSRLASCVVKLNRAMGTEHERRTSDPPRPAAPPRARGEQKNRSSEVPKARASSMTPFSSWPSDTA